MERHGRSVEFNVEQWAHGPTGATRTEQALSELAPTACMTGMATYDKTRLQLLVVAVVDDDDGEW